jgi:predicted PurR-regulated permease PerM
VIVALLTLGSAIVSPLVGPATEWIDKAPKKIKEVETKLSFIKEPIEKITDATEKVEELTDVNSNTNPSMNIHVGAKRLAESILDVTSNFFLTAATTLLLLFFLLVYGNQAAIQWKVVRSSSDDSGGAFSKIQNDITKYIATITVINLVLAILIGFSMYLAGLPNAPLWGAMAGILNFIPYLGALVGTTVVLFVSVLTFDEIWRVAIPPLAYFVINSLEGQILTPMVLGSYLRINPLFVLLSVVVLGWIWGIEGALVAVPLLAICKIASGYSDNNGDFSTIIESPAAEG